MKSIIAACMILACMSMMPGQQAVKRETMPDSLALESIISRSQPFHGSIGFSAQGRPIEAWYFPGRSEKKALVIGGMHGSELSSIEVARKTVELLTQQGGNFYSVIIIPCLFPDNANMSGSRPGEIGGVLNIGRYSNENSADPNRQMPAPGRPFDPENPVDFAGRTIEAENQLLLTVIQKFSPDRIVNLHAIRDVRRAGIYADPRTDPAGIALPYDADSTLAVSMALRIHEAGGWVAGNQLNERPTSVYHCDPPIAQEGRPQRRNFQGSKLPNGRGYGVSLGTWATTAVEEPSRSAITLITVEFPGYRRPVDFPLASEQQKMKRLVELYASSIHQVFLGGN